MLLGSQYESIHIIGAGGAGMSGLAKILVQSGHVVSGSDLVMAPKLRSLGDLGVDVWQGHDASKMPGRDLVVASSAVPFSDPELHAAREAGVVTWDRPRLLSELTARFPAIGATGTHGKTSTTAMIVHALQALGVDPSFVVGGKLVNVQTAASYTGSQPFVLEIDEAFGTFQHINISGLIVTNVEPEHLDYFGDTETMVNAYVEVMRRVNGPVVVCVDDPGARAVMERAGGISYGFADDADWQMSELQQTALSATFRLKSATIDTLVTVGKPGTHSARNAAGTLALLGELGFDVVAAAEALSSFQGVARRYELRAEVGGVTFIDDYAHHPTEVLSTLDAVKQGDWKRVWAVFQPHLYSRTAELYREFGQAFAGVDELVVLDVFASRELPQPGISGQLVADAAKSRTSANVRYVPHMSEVPGVIVPLLKAGDLVLTMGAGDVTILPEKLAQALAKRG